LTLTRKPSTVYLFRTFAPASLLTILKEYDIKITDEQTTISNGWRRNYASSVLQEGIMQMAPQEMQQMDAEQYRPVAEQLAQDPNQALMAIVKNAYGTRYSRRRSN
jgi:hypothetical protein